MKAMEKATKIMDICCDILEKYGRDSGCDLVEFKEEFLSLIKPLGRIGKKALQELEYCNFHTAKKIIEGARQ